MPRFKATWIINRWRETRDPVTWPAFTKNLALYLHLELGYSYDQVQRIFRYVLDLELSEDRFNKWVRQAEENIYGSTAKWRGLRP